ncbi:MAG: hypothetical protein AB7O28_16090 [Vicinamibacterales bacterium]
MRSTSSAGAPVRFDGPGGRLLGRLLQLPFVRYHRVQLGFVETPAEYEAFLRDVVGPRLDARPGRLGIFGVGAHTDLVLRVLPDLAARLHCFTDNNAVHWRRLRHGVTVLPPEDAARECDVFFLSTAVYQRVLEADLRRLGFHGPIVAMDDVVPPAWFLGRAA